MIPAKDLTIRECKVSEIKSFIEDKHYSHSINGVKVSYSFAVEHEGYLVGAVLFGAMSTTAWKRFAQNEYEVLELRSFSPKYRPKIIFAEFLRSVYYT
jgi:hypothetical protein